MTIELKFVGLAGVKRTGWRLVPLAGLFVGVTQTNDPATLARPLVNLEIAKDWPKVMTEEVGARVITGLALLTTRLTVLVTGETKLGLVVANTTLKL